MPRANLRKGRSSLRPRARIIRTIGRDLISNEVVALVELIKNAYDADAECVDVTFIGPLEKDKGELIVSDDGTGMSLDTVLEAWFEPATSKKVKRTITKRGRRVTGEKGIGRFASARIAQNMEMTTVETGSDRAVKVVFNWGEFDRDAKYLDQIECVWEETPLAEGQCGGTSLRLFGLNDQWSDKSFERLNSELARLVSPLDFADRKDRFAIQLHLPDEYHQYAGEVAPPPIIDKPHYLLRGYVDEHGSLEADYSSLASSEPEAIDKEIVLSGGRTPESGPFRFEFRVWDRDKASLEPLAHELESRITDLRRDLNSSYGISIYRDGFRILLADRDWLDLDHRRVQNPTMRLSTNQLVGFIWISADDHKELVDQSNRENIVSSPAFADFKDVIKELLSIIETRRYRYRHRDKPVEPVLSLFDRLDISSIQSYVHKNYPEDKELLEFIDEKHRIFTHGVSEVQKVISRYRRLASLGRLIDIVLHDGRTQVTVIKNAATLGMKETSLDPSKPLNRRKVEQQLLKVSERADVLSALFNRLSPLSGRKRGKMAPVVIESVIQSARETEHKRIRELDVKMNTLAGQTTVQADFGDILQIFENLLGNSLYWLSKVDKSDREIHIQILSDEVQVEVIFSDSGPGVEESVEDDIFDWYFSTKPDGVGIGLALAGEICVEYGGALELIEGGPLCGATFRVVLRRDAKG